MAHGTHRKNLRAYIKNLGLTFHEIFPLKFNKHKKEKEQVTEKKEKEEPVEVRSREVIVNEGDNCSIISTRDTAGSRFVADTIEEGTILHAFCWSFNTIAEHLDEIKKCGYTAIQTSPIQNCKVGNDGSRDFNNWYFHYQPIGYDIGNYQLGTEKEFKHLCSEARKRDIKVIVDAVLNHMSSDWNAIDREFRVEEKFHTGVDNSDGRFVITQQQLLGLNDVKTQDKDVQLRCLDFLKRCIADGASGFRYDTAKHIELPDDDPRYASDFWPTVLNNGAKFQYGEILQDNVSRESEYAKYMRITASNYGMHLRDAIRENNFNVNNIMNYEVGDIDGSRLITWVESHDTYSNDDLQSVWLNNEQIKLAWACIAARKATTPLFFSRPVGGGGHEGDCRFPGKSQIGDAGDDLYKNDEVVAVNLFRNTMKGEDEFLRNANGNNCVLMIERGRRGLVIINLNNSDFDVENETNLVDGKYRNRTRNNNEFTVSNGVIKGTVPSRSVAVLY